MPPDKFYLIVAIIFCDNDDTETPDDINEYVERANSLYFFVLSQNCVMHLLL